MNKLIGMMCLCACLLLMGCPLMTNSPIQGDQVKIPDWLPGKWTELKEGAPTGDTYLLEVGPGRPASLQVLTLDAAGTPERNDARPATVSLVGGQLFLSVYEKGDELSDAGYYHYALGRSGSTGDLQLVPIKEHVVDQETSGAQLAAFIAAKTNTDEYLEEKDITRYRKTR